MLVTNKRNKRMLVTNKRNKTMLVTNNEKNNEKNNIDLTYMPDRPTDVQRRRKSSDASHESTTPSSTPSSPPSSPPSYDLFVSHNLREIKQPKQCQKLYESNEPTFDYKLSYIFKEHSDILEQLLSSDHALTNMIYDMMNISITNKIDPEPKKEELKKEEPKKEDEQVEEEPKKNINNNEIIYDEDDDIYNEVDDIYNEDEVYAGQYKRRCFIS